MSGPPPAPPPGYPPRGYPPRGYPPSDGYAKASLVCALLSLLPTCGIVLGPTAVVLGYVAASRIRASGGQAGGSGLALAGRIVGAIVTAVWLAIVIVYYVFIIQGVRKAS